jgi:pantetheine-phosphate adenylyltransferase
MAVGTSVNLGSNPDGDSMTVKALFPGTFDPIHYGHIDIAHRAAKLFDQLVVAVYNRPLKSLLFEPEERMKMVELAFKDDPNIIVTGYSGLTVEFSREVGAQVVVRGLRVFSDFEHEFRMALANQRMDPAFEMIALITREEHTFLSSTTVREIASLGGDVTSMVPPYVADFLKQKFQDESDNLKMNYMTSLRD